MQNICNVNIIVATGVENIDFSKVISLNESAAVMWNAVIGKDFNAQDMALALTNEYEVDEATALADAQETLKQWIETGIVEP